MSLTGPGTFYEDFEVGEVLWHSRGRTIGDSEHMAWTCRVMNTAQLHFNQALCDQDPNLQAQYQGKRPVFGVFVTSVCMGLAAQDTTENALAITALEEATHKAGVFSGDTLFAKSEVLAKRSADRPDAGYVKFKLTGYKQDKKTVCVEATYEALIRRREVVP